MDVPAVSAGRCAMGASLVSTNSAPIRSRPISAGHDRQPPWSGRSSFVRPGHSPRDWRPTTPADLSRAPLTLALAEQNGGRTNNRGRIHRRAAKCRRGPDGPRQVPEHHQLKATRDRGSNACMVCRAGWQVTGRDRCRVRLQGQAHPAQSSRAGADSSASGRLRGDQLSAVAELLPQPEIARVHRLISQKYRADLVVIGPLRALQSALHPGRPRTQSVILSITLS